jgi:hypothetical protein
LGNTKNKIRYYHCVNCGYYGDFGFERQRGIKCKDCKYDILTDLTKEEYDEYTSEEPDDEEIYE